MAARKSRADLLELFASGQVNGSLTAARIRDFIASTMPQQQLVVESVADLPAAVGDEYILPESTTVIFSGAVDLGDKALRVTNNCLPRGFGRDMIISTNANGVVRADNIGSALVMREFSIVAPAGPCLAMTGSIDYQLNLFFMGLIGASAGTITGFDVQALKDCFVSTAGGIRHAGTTNKIFVSASPFYGVTPGNAAITLDAALDCEVVDLTTNFYKFDGAVGLRAEAGYNVRSGILRGVLIAGTATALEGLSPADTNWRMNDNEGIRDSRVAGQAFLTAPATTVIAAADTFVAVSGAFELSDLTERFEYDAAASALVYTGRAPALVTFNAAFAIDPANNNRLSFKATKNGIPLDYSEVLVEQGAGPGSSPRAGAVVALIEVVTGDKIGLAVANLTNADNVPWISATFAVAG